MNLNARSRVRSENGFTLVEMLLVLVILATLAGVVVPRFVDRAEQGRRTAAKTQIAHFGVSLDCFEVDVGNYPQGGDGLQDLVVQPRDATGWKGPYVKEIPLDPWGHTYLYECPSKHGAKAYDLSSVGRDGRAGTDDDITNWQMSQQR